MIMTEKRTSLYMHIIFLTKNIRTFYPLSEPEYYAKWDEKITKCQNDLFKSNWNSKVWGNSRLYKLSICLKYFQIISQIKIFESLLLKMVQYLKFVKYLYTYFLSPK